MVRGTNYRPQNSCAATNKEKLRKKGVGVACVVDNRCKENIFSFQPIGERVCTLRIETK
jgi:hypothetical protein